MDEVTPQEAYRLMEEEGYQYLDVRTEPEFAAGHPAGACCVPAFFKEPAGMVPNPDFVEQVKARIEPSQKLVVGCQKGGRSAKACEQLSAAGYTVVNVAGGFGGGQKQTTGEPVDGWAQVGLPVEEGDS